MLTQEYLDRARALAKTRSDYALAKFLGVSEGAVNQYRKGVRIMDDDTCIRLADALQIDVAEIIAARNIDRAKTPETKTRWTKELKRLASVAPHALLFALALTGTIGGVSELRAKTLNMDSGTMPSAAANYEPLYKLYASTLYRFCAKFAAYTSARCRSLRSRTPRAGAYATA